MFTVKKQISFICLVVGGKLLLSFSNHGQWMDGSSNLSCRFSVLLHSTQALHELWSSKDCFILSIVENSLGWVRDIFT